MIAILADLPKEAQVMLQKCVMLSKNNHKLK